MHYDLDLAIAYACVLGLFCWLASWFVPLAVRTVYGAARACLAPHFRCGPPGTPPGAPTMRIAQPDWWGPTHPSR